MTLIEAKRIAVDLMNKHNLILKGWGFEFDNSKRRLGCCKYRYKRLSFSKNYLPLIDVNEYINTVLHEIAHALVGSGHGHDYVWQGKALEIGCNGQRLYQGEVRVEGKYQAICPKCGKKHHKHRMTRSTTKHSCGCTGRFNIECLLIYSETN